MTAEISAGKLGVMGKLEVKASRIPTILIARVKDRTPNGHPIAVYFDVKDELLPFKEGESVMVTLTKERPSFKEGEDLVMWGYVVLKKSTIKRAVSGGGKFVEGDLEEAEEGSRLFKLIASFWGFIFEAVTTDEDILTAFPVMEKVYLRVTRA